VTAEYYALFRRGYPDSVVDRLVEVLGVGAGSRVLDLGCGSGQLTIPLARRVGVAIGADPQSDMLRLGREAGLAAGIDNIAWLLAADSDLDTLGALIGDGTLAAVTIGSAVHWMDQASLFARARRLLQPGGRVAVVLNGTPDWQVDAPWAQVLRERLEAQFGGPLSARTGTDAESQREVAAALTEAGFSRLDETVVEYPEERGVDELVGSLFSAISARRVERLRRGGFEEDLTRALYEVRPDGRFAAPVRVTIVAAVLAAV
jgi:ubiquinone/menaquinone biosynthesis C-methylase UbiE